MGGLKLHVIESSSSEIALLSDEELNDINPNYLSKQIQNLEADLKKSKPNMGAIEQFRKVEAVYIERAAELSQITTLRDQRKQNFEKLKSQRLEEFKQGFITISRKLKEMYRMITLGGDAELEWQDSLDPFSEGINFTVRPNKKSWKAITNLSGGEKTLSSLSLIFALHYFKPSPLYVMDEIDAALDFRNVSIVANYIKQRTRNTQFIIISLRNNMYELANKLIGIYKVENCTRSVSWDPSGIQEPDIVKDYNKKYTKTKSQMP
jgi:structural maintenance of chromosome 4